MKSFAIAAGLLMATTSFVSAQEVTVTALGADEGLQNLLQDASLSRSVGDETDPVPQDYIAAARADYRRLLTALYAAGYYSGTISIKVNGTEASNLSPLAAPARINTIEIAVNPGQLFTFGRAEVAPLAPGTELPEGFAVGEDAKANVIRQAATTAQTAWRNEGYAKAEIASQNIVAQHSENRLSAEVAIDTGPQLTFGPLTVTGNQNVRTAAILRIAGLPTGQIYSPDEMTAAARRLRETGAFDSAALTEAEEIGPNNTLPIEAAIVEAAPRRIGAGIEYSTVEGVRLSSYWIHRNFFGGAENLRVDAEVAGLGGGTGGVDYGLSTALKIPAIDGPLTDLTIRGEVSRLDEPDFLLDSLSIEAIVDRQFTDELSAEVGLGLLTARAETPFGNRRYTLVTAPLAATADYRDSQANPKSGYYLNAQATPFVGLSGAKSGARLYGDARGYLSFGSNDRVTIAARGQVGSVIGPDANKAPVDYLFFSGGTSTVRGEGYNSLGVDTVVNGEPVTQGGLSFAGAQLEARVGITNAISAVAFYDYGYVGASATPLTDGGFQSGVGLGVRYDTGIGPIRLDVGTPATGDNAFGSVEVYIGIGQAF